MTPAELKQARHQLGLSVPQLASLLDTDPQTIRRMEQREDAKTFRSPAPRMLRMINAYLLGYRPDDWPLPPGHAEEGDALLEDAFIAGAMAVHAEWVRAHEAGEAPPRGDPEFSEAASDYALENSSRR